MDKFVTRCKQEIARLEEARREIVENGQKYTINGSHSVDKVKLAEIDAAIRAERLKIMAWCNGGRGNLRPVEVTRYE